MLVRIEMSLEIDPDAWSKKYGTNGGAHGAREDAKRRFPHWIDRHLRTNDLGMVRTGDASSTGTVSRTLAARPKTRGGK